MYPQFPKFGSNLPTTEVKKAEASQLIFFPFEEKCTARTLFTYLQYPITTKKACDFGTQCKGNAEKCMAAFEATANMDQPLQDTFSCPIDGIGK